MYVRLMILSYGLDLIQVFDFKPLLSSKAFEPLSDVETFKGVYIDYGVTVWNDGDIDISPEQLYTNSVSVENIA